ncbi:hypothetical protein CLOM_g1633 [Closterium sp. NIES-68]|nr:hypothetical protein CLOM_g1633 [Closterium sp. NIES-68]GJP71083.1 hypothetical protein CLOP_g1944 [Closterium sp. NIES-67]
MQTRRESHRGLERRLPLLGSLAYLLVLRGVVSVRLHLDDVGSIQELARRWNNFEGSEIWGLRYVDCMAMEGILCDKDGFVTDIVLQQKGFYAPIPTMISKLQHLRHLSLMFCTLTGTIPDSLFNLTSLSVLDVVGNFITGTVPVGISRLVNLRVLGLGLNQLSGPLDPLSNLPQLIFLHLDQNLFNGSISSELGKLTTLRFLSLKENEFSASIPSSLGNLASLNELTLSVNQLSGTIPDSLSGLHSLTNLNLHTNQLTGAIPESLGALSALKFLELQYNRLNGSIPATLSSLQQLEWLMISGNLLSGSIPAALGDIPLLKYMWLALNQLSGSIPTAIGKLANLVNLDMWNNQLCGTIPTTLHNLSKVQYLALSYNQLSGPVEPIIRGMRSVTDLYLQKNQFSGRLPIPAPAGMKNYVVANNFFSHGQVKFSNCSAVKWNTYSNCLSKYLGICRLAYAQKSAAECAAFCGLEVGATGPVCGGHGYCLVNPSTGASECVCDPNYMLSSSNSNACVPGAAETFLVSASAYVSLRGSASVLSNGSILLTNGAANQQGAAFGSPAMRLFYFPDKRSRCGTELGFLAAFSFAMSPGGQGEGGEGLAFVVAAGASEKGASVGLGGVGRRSMGVEFDSVLSVKHSDPNDNHVGVNVGGSPVSLASATAPLILNDAQTKHAWIHYDPTSGGTLQVFLSSDPVQPLTPTLTASVSLCSVLKPTASDSLFLFGFLALSSTAPQRLGILSWNFTGVSPVG